MPDFTDAFIVDFHHQPRIVAPEQDVAAAAQPKDGMPGEYFAAAEGRQFGCIVQFGKVAGTSRQAEGVERLQVDVFLYVYHDDLE